MALWVKNILIHEIGEWQSYAVYNDYGVCLEF